MTRIAVASLDPVQVAIWRALLAAAAGGALLLLTRARMPRRAELVPLCLCAAGTVFGFPLFTTLAMQTGSAAHGAVVVGLLPLGTAIVAVLVNAERPGPGFWIAGVFGTTVTLAFALQQSDGRLAPSDIFLGFAVLSAAVGYAFGGKAAKSLGGWQVSCWALVVSLPLLLPLALVCGPIPHSTPSTALGAFAYLALVSQLAGFFAWYRGMALAGVAAVSQVQLLQLFLTVLAAAVLLGEPVDAHLLGFGALVVLSVWGGTWARIRAA